MSHPSGQGEISERPRRDTWVVAVLSSLGDWTRVADCRYDETLCSEASGQVCDEAGLVARNHQTYADTISGVHTCDIFQYLFIVLISRHGGVQC